MQVNGGLRDRVENADEEADHTQSDRRRLTLGVELLADKCDETFCDGDGGADCRKEQQHIEQQTENSAGGHSFKHAAESTESKAAALAHSIRTERCEHSGNDDEAGEKCDHGIQTADDQGVLGDAFLFGEVRAVGSHDRHAERQGEECLTEGGDERAAVDLAEVGGEHVLKTFRSAAAERDGTDKQNDQNNKQGGHADLVEFFDTAGNALEQDVAVQRHENSGKRNGSPGEEERTAHSVIAEQVVEVVQSAVHNGAALGDIGGDVTEHPAADMTVVAKDNERADDTEPTGPGEAPVKLAEDTDGVLLRMASERKLGNHNGNADQQYDGEINDQVGRAAACIRLTGKFPNVAETNGGPGCGENKADFARPLFTLFFHDFLSFSYPNDTNT